jgi:hypothetical protein
VSYSDVVPGPGARETILGTGSERVRVLNGAALSADAPLVGMGGRLMGWAVRESTGAAAAVVDIYDGASVGGTRVVPAAVGAGGFAAVYFGDLGIDIEQGLYVHIVSGSADVTCYFRADTGEY